MFLSLSKYTLHGDKSGHEHRQGHRHGHKHGHGHGNRHGHIKIRMSDIGYQLKV
jgi:ABC-type Zn2+ transport system substrate-binding protein/surface adhesin